MGSGRRGRGKREKAVGSRGGWEGRGESGVGWGGGVGGGRGQSAGNLIMQSGGDGERDCRGRVVWREPASVSLLVFARLLREGRTPFVALSVGGGGRDGSFPESLKGTQHWVSGEKDRLFFGKRSTRGGIGKRGACLGKGGGYDTHLAVVLFRWVVGSYYIRRRSTRGAGIGELSFVFYAGVG